MKGSKKFVKSATIEVLDARKIPHGVDYDVEITKNNDRGQVNMKIYGLSTKKGFSVIINKSKKYEARFVKVFAEDVIKLLIDTFISGEGWKGVLKEETRQKGGQKMCKCDSCGKSFKLEKI